MTDRGNAVAKLIEACDGLKFDIFEITHPHLIELFDGRRRINVVDMPSIRTFAAALAACKGGA